MTDDLALFGNEPPAAPEPVVDASTPIADWQRDLIRKALDARGLASMEDRQSAVAGVADRDIASLRDLTHDEAIRVLNRLGQTEARSERSASLWESRDEDTWIDRL